MTVVYKTSVAARPNPQKRNLLIRRLARAPWWLLAMALLIIIFALNVSDQHPYPVIWRAVKQGIWTTIWVSIVAYSIALVLGLLVALLRRSLSDDTVYIRPGRGVWGLIVAWRRWRRRLSRVVIYQLATFYVEAVRGIPTLVLVYYMALALIPELIMLGNDLGDWLRHLVITVEITPDLTFDLTFGGIGTRLAEFKTRDFDNSYRAIIGLAISYSAFLSEIFRAGIDSVSTGQREAASSLGMTRWQTMRLIVLPQAIRTVLPPLGNDFIAMLKESSLVSVLGVTDITRRGQTYATSTFTFFQVYNVVALTYLVLTLSLSMAVKLMEMYLDRGKHR